MKEGEIRKRFNAASAALEKTPEGKNTARVLGALKDVTLALREEGFEATMTTRYGAAGFDESFSEEDTERATANGEVTLKGEKLPFLLWDDGYEGGDMYFKISWQGVDIFAVTSTWDESRRRWDDTYEEGFDDEEEVEPSTGGWSDGYETQGSPARPGKRVTLEGKIADALIDVLAKTDLAERHTVKADEGLEKTFKVPAQIKLGKGPGEP